MLQPPPLPRTMAAALRDLDDTDPRVRASAARDLAFHVADDAFAAEAALRKALRDPHHEPRAAAASVAGEAALASLLPDLLALADDEHPLPCQMALEALAEIDDPRAEARLRKALGEPRPEARFQAVMGLPRRLDDGEADRALAAAARDDDAGVRYIALRVAEERLAEGPLTLEAAAAALADPDDNAKAAAALLLSSRGDRRGVQVLLSIIEGKLRPAEIHDEAAAVEAAGKLGLAQATAALERRAYGAARLLREQCSFHARVSLARLGHKRARADLLKGLDSWSYGTRTESVLGAARAGLREALAPIEAMVGRPERADQAVVREALEALREGR